MREFLELTQERLSSELCKMPDSEDIQRSYKDSETYEQLLADANNNCSCLECLQMRDSAIAQLRLMAITEPRLRVTGNGRWRIDPSLSVSRVDDMESNP